MNKLKFLIVVLCALFWPLSLFFANTFGDFINYLIPALLLGLSIFLFQRRVGFYLFPILLIPFVEPKLAVFPLIVAGLVLIFKFEKRRLVFFLLSLVVLVLTWKGFWGQTIFQPDYEAQQGIIGRLYLYPNVATARLFQNKPRIYINKFNSNFFALVDPNNYFFNFHPREILIDNQNLNKYPFMGIVFAVVGFYYLLKHPQWRFISIILASLLLSLSILKIFDRNDFLLWVPLSLVIIHGINSFKLRSERNTKIFLVVFLIFTVPELVRILLR